jgi:hypothetical protein
MLVGPIAFSETYLEPTDSDPPGDGFASLRDAYCSSFLTPLKTRNWGPLAKIFEFPVYGVGYNWTASVETAGQKLAERIGDIIKEARKVVGLCEKVILITHSMGGLVARAASELKGAAGSILGIVHAVQPATGAPAAYWRMKAGFEGSWIISSVLGLSAREVTPVLGNIPGGLQLLPTKLHRTHELDSTNVRKPHQWLTVTEDGTTILALPKSDPPNPYRDIYRIKAVVWSRSARPIPRPGETAGMDPFWGLVDPDLLDPGRAHRPTRPPNTRDEAHLATSDPWAQYIDALDVAERFHDLLGDKTHPRTFCVSGVGHDTADVIELEVSSRWLSEGDPYPNREFRGFFTNSEGKSMKAVLQDPAGVGDGTVVLSSAVALNKQNKQRPGDRDDVEVEHEPAYANRDVQTFVFEAVIALCKMRYEDRRHPLGDFPATSAHHA